MVELLFTQDYRQSYPNDCIMTVKDDGHGTHCRLPRRFVDSLYRATERPLTEHVPYVRKVNGKKVTAKHGCLILGEYALKLTKMGSEWAEFEIGVAE